jgi:hypothetical protein
MQESSKKSADSGIINIVGNIMASAMQFAVAVD